RPPPVIVATTTERRRHPTDPSQRLIAHVVELAARDHSGSMTGKRVARRINQHQAAAPTAHTCFWISGIVIGDDGVNSNLACQPSFGRGYDCQRLIEVFSGRHQRSAILKSPARIVFVSNR